MHFSIFYVIFKIMLHALPALAVVGFAFGIFFRSFFDFGYMFALLIIIAGSFLYLFTLTAERKVLLPIAVFLFVFAAGILRYEIKDSFSVSEELRPKIGEKVLLEGVIIDEPDERENSTRLILKSDTGDKTLLVTNRYPEFSYGDVIEARGILKEPQNFSDFDYQAYLARDDIFLEMAFPDIVKIGSGSGNPLKTKLLELKRNYLEGLSRVLPEPEASFLGAITVGAKRAMPEDVLEDFRKSGLAHVVVLSGMHVTIIAAFIAFIFGAIFPRFLTLIFGVVAIFIFAIFAGATATVIRASLMASALYLAGLSGRVYDAKRALLVAGFVMILANPKILRFDLSFQLSFLATLGILYLFPYLKDKMTFLPDRFFLRETGALTMSAQIFVSPLILYKMGTFSLAAFPANLLVLPSIPFAMFFGAGAGFLGAIFAPLVPVFSWPAYFLASYALNTAHFFASLPLASINF